MKTIALRAIFIGLCFAALIIIAGAVSLMNLIKMGWVMFGPSGLTVFSFLSLLPYSLVSLYQLTFCGYPILLLGIVLFTWLATRSLLRNSMIRDGKNQLMIAVWLSLTVSASPFLLAAMIDFSNTLIENGIDGNRGSKYELAAALLLFVESIILIVLMGLLSRLLVRNNQNLQPRLIEDVK
jgi:hypothetical protein